MRLNTRIASVCALLVLATGVARAEPAWVIIGDSWGDFIGPVQEAKLATLGITNFTNLAVGGTTAAQWAADESGLLSGALDTLAAMPSQDVAFVYVSIGGNDILGEWASQGSALFARVAGDLATVRSALLAAKSNTVVLLGGYDILNFESSLVCQITASALFGTTDPTFINSIVRTGGLLLDNFAQGRARTLSLSVIGALQGMADTPDLTNWSPAELIRSDCIHLTDEGYTVFNDAMFAELVQQLGGGGLLNPKLQ